MAVGNVAATAAAWARKVRREVISETLYNVLRVSAISSATL